jgi:hypothetical protein
MSDNNSWFAKDSRCKECGYNIVVSQASVESGMDYWWYCSNKMCEHHKGEETGDMEKPEWVVDALIEKKEK